MDKQTIEQVQRLLESLGHSPGDIDGIWGKKSQTALDAATAQYVNDINVGDTGGGSSDEWDEGFEIEVPNFKLEEFRCKCQGQFCNGFPHKPKKDMVRIAQKIRTHFGCPVRVISGLRCETWNRLQSGVAKSQHLYGEACDIWVSGVSWQTVLDYVKSLPDVRWAYHIEGSSNIHFDIPKGKR